MIKLYKNEQILTTNFSKNMIRSMFPIMMHLLLLVSNLKSKHKHFLMFQASFSTPCLSNFFWRDNRSATGGDCQTIQSSLKIPNNFQLIVQRFYKLAWKWPTLISSTHQSLQWRYPSPLILFIQKPRLQLPHHHLPLPLSYRLTPLIMGGHQIVNVWQVGLFSGQDHHLTL